MYQSAILCGTKYHIMLLSFIIRFIAAAGVPVVLRWAKGAALVPLQQPICSKKFSTSAAHIVPLNCFWPIHVGMYVITHIFHWKWPPSLASHFTPPEQLHIWFNTATMPLPCPSTAVEEENHYVGTILTSYGYYPIKSSIFRCWGDVAFGLWVTSTLPKLLC